MNFVDMPSKLSSNEKDKLYLYGEDALQNAIHNIFVTQPGSVPGHPAFGCKLGNFLFDQIDPLVESMIKAEIIYSIKRWEPRVRIINIDVIEDSDYNRLSIKMKYVIVRDPYNVEREYIFSTSNIT